MAWLLRGDEVLASLEVAEGVPARARQLLGRKSCEGAFLAPGARTAHTIGVPFGVDVAYLDGELVVVGTATMHPYRVGMPRRRARSVLEAPAGAFERWNLRPGDRLEIKA
jgi:uncharacterized membrane protein (UPF0127 family)